MNKILFKICSLTLIVAMLFTPVGVPAFAQEEASSDAKYAEELLTALGIVDGDENLDEKVSRAEFAILLTHFTGVFSVNTNDNVSFRDVLPGVAEEAYIDTAVAMGYMAPVNKDYFYPAYAISATDAARSFLMALGYGEIVVDDKSFASFAKSLDLYDNVDIAHFTRGEVYKMMYNALMANVMEQVGFGENMQYEQLSDVNGLYKFHSVVRAEGTITGAEGISLGTGRANALEEGVIQLNGTKFKYTLKDATKFLGRRVYLYWEDVRSSAVENTIHIEVIEDESITLSADDITGFSSMTYEYEQEDGSLEKIALNRPYVVYNGEEYTGAYTSTVMWPENGDVTIIEDMGGSGNDLVIIRSFVDYLVTATLSADKVVVGTYYDYDNSGAVVERANRFDFKEHEEGVKYYYADGTTAQFMDIKQNSVISVASSSLSGGAAVPRTQIVYISNNVINSAVTLKDSNYWTIDGTEYTLTRHLRDSMAGSNPLVKEPDFNVTHDFYINAVGKIAFIEKSQSASATGDDSIFYAFVTKMGVGTGLDAEVSARVFSKTAGGFADYNFADKVELNGQKGDKINVIGAFKQNGRDGTPTSAIVPQPVKIGLNAENEIDYILQASSDISNPDGLGFYLYMGSYPNSDGDGDNTNDKTGQYYQYRDVLSYSDPNGTAFAAAATSKAKQLGVSKNTEYIQIPYFDDGTIDVDTEKAFITSSRPSNVSSQYLAYVEEDDDLTAAFVVRVTGAGVREHCGDTFNVHAVMSITEQEVDGEIVTVVKTNKMSYYLNNPNIDLNNLKIFESYRARNEANSGYDYPTRQWIDENGNPGTHKVVPGDLVNIYADSLGYIQAMEIVYDSVNRKMMGKGITTGGTNYHQTENMWLSRNGMYNMVLVNILEVKDGYLAGTTDDLSDGYDPDALYPAYTYPEIKFVSGVRQEVVNTVSDQKVRYFIGAVPPIMCIEKKGNKLTSRNAVGADLLGYYTAGDEYASVILSHRYAQQNGTSYLIK